MILSWSFIVAAGSIFVSPVTYATADVKSTCENYARTSRTSNCWCVAFKYSSSVDCRYELRVCPSQNTSLVEPPCYDCFFANTKPSQQDIVHINIGCGFVINAVEKTTLLVNGILAHWVPDPQCQPNCSAFTPPAEITQKPFLNKTGVSQTTVSNTTESTDTKDEEAEEEEQKQRKRKIIIATSVAVPGLLITVLTFLQYGRRVCDWIHAILLSRPFRCFAKEEENESQADTVEAPLETPMKQSPVDSTPGGFLEKVEEPGGSFGKVEGRGRSLEKVKGPVDSLETADGPGGSLETSVDVEADEVRSDQMDGMLTGEESGEAETSVDDRPWGSLKKESGEEVIDIDHVQFVSHAFIVPEVLKYSQYIGAETSVDERLRGSLEELERSRGSLERDERPRDFLEKYKGTSGSLEKVKRPGACLEKSKGSGGSLEKESEKVFEVEYVQFVSPSFMLKYSQYGGSESSVDVEASVARSDQVDEVLNGEEKRSNTTCN